MSAKSEDLFSLDDLDSQEMEIPDLDGDDDLFFEASQAMKDQIEEDFAGDDLAPGDSDKEDDDLDKVEQDASLDILSTTSGIVELGDDPVRLYLKDIGSIELLDVNHEFWLAARMAAIRRLDVIGRQHPTASKGGSLQNRIYRALFEELSTAWKRVGEDTVRLKYVSPDFRNIFSEARTLRQTWQSEEPSYTRAYLDNGLWGKDPFWDEVAKKCVLGVYLAVCSTARNCRKCNHEFQ